jgi:uncharacterized membrane protein YidH (DUF202 family)
MAEPLEESKAGRVGNRRVHMANERTFLAWIRTSIGIMAFGFVVEKFAVFVRQVSLFLGKSLAGDAPHTMAQYSPQYSSALGIFLMGLGAVMGVLAFVRYKKVERQIDEDAYHPSLILDILLTIAVVAVGVFLVIYLSYTL